MNGLIAQSPSGAWTSGAAVLTTVFPMLLFIVVAGALYILYTKPETAPGHRSAQRPISYTSLPGEPSSGVSGTPAAERVTATPAAERGQTPAAEDGVGAAESESTEAKGDE